MDRLQALKIWEHEYGDLEYAYDFAGRKIKRADYGIQNQVGWVVSYMCPLCKKGTTDIGNTIIMHHHTESEKGDSYPHFKVDEIEYIVRHVANDDYYFIELLNHYDEDED